MHGPRALRPFSDADASVSCCGSANREITPSSETLMREQLVLASPSGAAIKVSASPAICKLQCQHPTQLSSPLNTYALGPISVHLRCTRASFETGGPPARAKVMLPNFILAPARHCEVGPVYFALSRRPALFRKLQTAHVLATAYISNQKRMLCSWKAGRP